MTRKNKNRLLTGVDLIRIHYSGKTYGYAGSHRVYTENGIPGENVDVRITGRQQEAYLGKVVNVNRSSESRVVPFCSHFDLCGGCNWQHFDYQAQLFWKQELLNQALKKYDISSPVILPAIPSPVTVFYRNRIEYAFSSRRWYYEGEGRIENPEDRKAMGFHLAENPYKVLQIEKCYLQPEPGPLLAKNVEAFAREKQLSFYDPKAQTGLLRSLIIRTTIKGEIMLIVIFSEDDPLKRELLLEFLNTDYPIINSLYYVVVDDIRKNYTEGKLVLYNGTSPFIFERCNRFTFRISPQSFYQPNPLQAEAIYKKIISLSGLTGNETVYDLYCGIGTIAIHVAATARAIIGIDGSASSVDDAVHNASLNGITNARFICGDVLGTFTPAFVEGNGKPDLVILDPPRSGTLIEIKKTILFAAPRKIIYLSCNPVSLASDLKMLIAGYHITYIQPFDMFPHTNQVETLVMLELKRSAEPKAEIPVRLDIARPAHVLGVGQVFDNERKIILRGN